MFDCPEALIPAKRLAGLPRIDLVEDAAGTEFFHLVLPKHSVIGANGALTESCLLGPVVLGSLPTLLRTALEVETPEVTRYPAEPFRPGKKVEPAGSPS